MNQGQLFSDYFLRDGVTINESWSSISPAALEQVRDTIAGHLDNFMTRYSPNEAETERDLIEPLLRLLEWADFLPQQTAAPTGRSDVPDYLLFASPEAKRLSAPLPSAEKYRHGASILEAKAWEVSLDKAAGNEGAPSTQLLRYLGRVRALPREPRRLPCG